MTARIPARIAARLPLLFLAGEARSLLPIRLKLLVLFALILRLGWIFAFTAVVENEGTEYARIAENLLQGRGYVGLREPGPQLLFPPLFPLLIAAVSLVTGHADLAGRLVSALFGTALVPIVFFLTARIHAPRVAYLAAGLTAFHPWLIGMSATIYSETTYLTLLMAGAYWTLRSVELHRWLHALLSGICFGLAYLTRPEAFLFPFVSIAFIVAMNRRTPATALRYSCALLGSFLLLATPYIAFLTHSAGQIRIEGKTSFNYQIGQRMLAGMNYAEAAYGLGKDLTPQGVYLQPDPSVLRATRFDPREMARYMLASARRNIVLALQAFMAAPYFGAPLLPALVILGLFAKPWCQARATQETFLFAILIGIGLALLSVQFLYTRFLHSFLAVLIIWGARGIAEFSRWTAGTLAALGWRRRHRHFVAIAAQWPVSALLLLIALMGSWPQPDLAQGRSAERPARDAGEWLKTTVPGPKRIMDSSGLVSFYAGAALLNLPYAESPLALKYIESKQPDFIVIRSALLNRPYLQRWAETGVPDERADLIYKSEDALAGSVLIYRWTRR